MPYAYLLYKTVLHVTQLVKIAVYLGQVHILIEMLLQIFHRRSLASRI